MSCGDSLWAGGASVQGTGDPRPNNPGPADDDHNLIQNLWLAGPVTDECYGLKRQLQFLDNITGEPITQESTFNLNHQLRPNGTVRLQLTVTNNSEDTITERQPDCYVPVALYWEQNENRLYPDEQGCAGEHSISYAPQQSRTFEIPYMTVGEMQATWKYGEESNYVREGRKLAACDTLNIKFRVYNTQYEVLN